ncbi:MAG: hypothetical protein WCY08_06685 [Rhodocyclaceae bacterium]
MRLRTGLVASTRKGGESLRELENLKALEELEARRKLYEAGDKLALFEALVICAYFQAVMPEWMADVLIESERRYECGDVACIGDMFGKPTESKAQRKAAARYREIEGDVLHLLRQWRTRGGTFNAEECFDQIKDDLGCGRRDVQKIYEKHRSTLLKIEKKGPDADLASVFVKIEAGHLFPRRSGRPVF